MNSVERVHGALQRQQPDRVPVIEFLVDEKVWRAAMPDCRDMADFMDRVGLDNVGTGARFDVVRENPDGSYFDEWGVRYKPSAEALSHPIGGPIQTMADARAYVPPDPDAPQRLGNLRDLVARYKGKRTISFHHRAAFMWAAYLTGLDNLLVYFLTEPELAACVLEKVLECNMGIVRNAVRAGAEVIVLGDDYAHNKGPLMDPEHFRVLVLPRLQRMVEMIHDEGALCIKHSDGYLYPLLDMIVSTGVDAIDPIEPLAGMELKKVKALYGDLVCIVGNIDCGHLLPHGTEAEVREAVRQAIADAAPGGGYILSSSNSIHSSCNPRNYVAMVEAGHEFGAYAGT